MQFGAYNWVSKCESKWSVHEPSADQKKFFVLTSIFSWKVIKNGNLLTFFEYFFGVISFLHVSNCESNDEDLIFNNVKK